MAGTVRNGYPNTTDASRPRLPPDGHGPTTRHHDPEVVHVFVTVNVPLVRPFRPGNENTVGLNVVNVVRNSTGEYHTRLRGQCAELRRHFAILLDDGQVGQVLSSREIDCAECGWGHTVYSEQEMFL